MGEYLEGQLEQLKEGRSQASLELYISLFERAYLRFLTDAEL